MHGPAAVGGRSRAIYALLGSLCLVLALVWAYREYALRSDDAVQTRLALEAALRDQAQQQEELLQLRARNRVLEDQVAQQVGVVSQAQALTNTAQSQTLADQAAQNELSRQLKLLQQENGRLKQNLAFFQSTIPKDGVKGGVALRSFEAQRITPTQLHWQALIVQPVKNAQTWTGHLSITVSGVRDGKPWSQGLADGPKPVSLVQFVRLNGLINLPAGAEAQVITAQLLQGKRVLAVQTQKIGS